MSPYNLSNEKEVSPQINIVCLNVVCFEFYTVPPRLTQFFDAFQIMRIVEILKVGVCMRVDFDVGVVSLSAETFLKFWKHAMVTEA